MRIKNLLAGAAETLRHQTNPHLEAEFLLSHILKKPREYLLTYPEKKLSAARARKFLLLIKKRARGWPAAYLTGEKEFYGLKFFVDKNVLIPRPETELMVEEALRHITRNIKHITFIDVGTGSGCIIISIAKAVISNFKFSPPSRGPAKAAVIFNKSSILNFKFFGTDVSRKALAIAKKNAEFHNVNKQIYFMKSNLLDSIPKSKICNLKSKILILANLPYLTPLQIKNSPTIKYEPKLALAAGPDGLKYYRKLFSQINKLKIQNCLILCEIDSSQAIKIKKLARTLLPLARIAIKKDLKGLNRLVIIRL